MPGKEYEGLKAELEPVLREYYNDDDFVFGVLNRLKTDRQVIEMMRFVDYAETHGEEVTQRDLILLSIALSDGVGSCGDLGD